MSAVLKSTKNSANGKNIVEEPKPAIAPIISEIKATTKTRYLLTSSLQVHGIWEYKLFHTCFVT